MEKAARKFAEENDIRLSIILPTGLYGEAVLPEHMRHNPFAWLARAIDGAECQKILPNMRMPEPIAEPAVDPTGFDFSRRDSLGVNIRDFPTFLRQTIEWIQSKPFQ